MLYFNSFSINPIFCVRSHISDKRKMYRKKNIILLTRFLHTQMAITFWKNFFLTKKKVKFVRAYKECCIFYDLCHKIFHMQFPQFCFFDNSSCVAGFKRKNSHYLYTSHKSLFQFMAMHGKVFANNLLQ